ncbi:transposase [bacterium]|nr:transposase [bacterium]
MKQKRHSIEDSIRILREADQREATTEEVCRQHNIALSTLHRWRRKYGQLELAEARRLKQIEKENTELKKIVADQLLNIRALEIALGKKL